ncbi:MAG: 4Fe-4S dicluster domain-containing protein [Hamadaea sp.]|uniref:4Fe-4S dicluster domain-containing protein n=1 Tax=Hamadaea sp. TaxID=2024425 RepID=UPI00184154F1|nr:4Fe-4S dicluster domain-containing protein [Hamadaea sp.]NUT18843.1 4Fe-4S dicluster domain-containing protein [Hamadaea sp.]
MVVLTGLTELVARLRAEGYRVVGPTVRDDAIVLDEIQSADELPYGYGVDAAPGRYRLRRRGDAAAFGHSAGPQSWKQFLHPPRRQLWTADRDGGSFTVTEPANPDERLALLGVRPCDLAAIAVQRRVFGEDSDYARRIDQAFVIAVNCTEPAEVCFCVSAGGGPRADTGYDLALTELANSRYLVEIGSETGSALLSQVVYAPAEPGDIATANDQIRTAENRMSRALPDTDLPGLLRRAAESPHWDDVASRCLTCGNCTMVCPTCFCTSVVDTTDVTGDHAERWQGWASCFDLDYSELHGGQVRTSGASRYRQWLTHKFGTWHAQFGQSGCVGCGRCVAWCPVGIDVTAELTALAATSDIDQPVPS